MGSTGGILAAEFGSHWRTDGQSTRRHTASKFQFASCLAALLDERLNEPFARHVLARIREAVAPISVCMPLPRVTRVHRISV